MLLIPVHGRAEPAAAKGKPPMKPTRKLNRRSFFAAVAGGVALTGALGIVLPQEAQALQGSDSDSGPNADPPGGGRGSRNCTDSDSGRYSDPAGQGRHCGARAPVRNCSDSDSGRYGDPAGRGRRCGGGGRRRTGITDRDSGRYADAPGYGNGRRRRSCTDSDTGRYSDPAGRGRRC
jgi:hypothetical protein